MKRHSSRCLIALTFVVALIGENIANVTYIRVGIILGTGNDSPYDLERSGAAIDLAVDRVNTEILNDRYKIQTVKRTFSGGCDVTQSTGCMLYTWLFGAVFIGCYIPVGADVITLYMGVLLETGNDEPGDMLRTGAAIELAVEEVNSNILNDNYHLVTIKRGFIGGCNATTAQGYAADMAYLKGVAAFVGPGCTLALDPVARLAGYWNIPILTGLGDSGRFKNKAHFQTLTRFSYCQCRLRKVFGTIFSYFHWTDITVIMDRDHEHSLILGETLDVGLQKGGYKPNIVKFYSQNDPDYEDILRDASEISRIMVISAHGDDVRRFLIAAYDLGYPQSGEYVFLDVELIHFTSNYYGDHSWYRGNDDDEKARKAYESMIRIGLYMPTGDLFTDFERKVKINAKRDYNFDYDARREEVNYFVGAFYDAIIHYGRQVNETLDTLGMDAVLDGYRMTRRLWNQTFQGVTGPVFLDDNGDRDTNFKIMDMNPETGIFEDFDGCHRVYDCVFLSVLCFPPYKGGLYGMKFCKSHWEEILSEASVNAPCGSWIFDFLFSIMMVSGASRAMEQFPWYPEGGFLEFLCPPE
ncbi:hypothetical protein LSH36_293g01000 [Paralvinella palmiformis]|uniref:Receptor ligand binding region domain-containing protein n=1 Tax=Paralvinella palmiformis TaxID=53620 RepID=A0AAD9JJV2_9ANNE|nr:hypothetical protein LSH36_293g01000 [Paralvinella palmiformis]